MKSIPLARLAAICVAVSAIAGPPAVAQQRDGAAPQAAAWAPKYTKAEQNLLAPISTAVTAKDWAAAQAAVAAAQPGVTSPDAKFFLGRALFEIAEATQNAQLQAQGLDAMIASGGGDPTLTPRLIKAQGDLARNAKDYAKAQAAYTRYAQLVPNDPDAQFIGAELALLQKNPQQALTISERAIAARKASGQAVPERWYLVALQSALDLKATPKTVALSRQVLGAYPTAKNWNNGLRVYQQSTPPDPQQRLDTLRLMRAAKALDQTGDYLTLASLLQRGNYYAEAQSVLSEGAAAGKIPAGNADASAIRSDVSGKIAGDRAALPGLEARARSEAGGAFALKIAEGYYGHADYAKAADFYRLALQKGGVDAATVNTRLGMAHALAGRKAEAETAFKAVTGPRADLAAYWLIWLNQRG